LVADFVTSPEVEAIDRGFSARMDRKGINYPIQAAHARARE
jgi:hypothetical protein